MQITELLGKKVVDKNAMEIGKVSDIDLIPKKGVIKSLTISTGDMWLRNKNFVIIPSDINEIGDYVLLNLEIASIKEIVEGEKEKEEKKKTRLNLDEE